MMFIIGVLIGAAVVVFMLQNLDPVTVMFLGWQFDGSLAIIVLLAVIAGMLISALLSLPSLIRSKFQVSNLKSHNQKLESELNTHRDMLRDAHAKLAEKEVVIEKTTVISEVNE